MEPEALMRSPVTVYLGVVYWICSLRDVTDKRLIDGAVNKYLGRLSASAALAAKGKKQRKSDYSVGKAWIGGAHKGLYLQIKAECLHRGLVSMRVSKTRSAGTKQ